jgi:hypothetical protein
MFTPIQRRALGACCSAGAPTPRMAPHRLPLAGRVFSARAEQPTLQQEQETQLLQAAFNASLERIVGAMPGSEQQSIGCLQSLPVVHLAVSACCIPWSLQQLFSA